MRLLGVNWIAAALGLCLLGSVSIAKAEPVTLTTGMDSIPLAGHIEVLRDDTGRLTFQDIISAPHAARFAASDNEVFNQGWDAPPVWYRLLLHRPHDEAAEDWILEAGIPTLDEVSIYLTRRDGSTATFALGDTRHIHPGQLSHRNFAIPIRLLPGEELTLHLRVRNQAAHMFFPELWPATAFQRKAATENLIFGAFFGILLIMALYNLSIFAWLRDRAYLYYVLYLVSMVFVTSLVNGYGRQYGAGLFDSAPFWISNSYPYAIHLTVLFAILFAREFLQLKSTAPRLNALFSAFAVWSGTNVLLAVVLPYSWSVRTGVINTGALAALSLVVSAYLAWKGSRPAKFYLLASAVFLLSLVVSVMSMVAGQAGPVVPIIWQAGICLEAALLSLALADSFAVERRDRERFARLKQYLPQKVADLVSGGDKTLLEPKRRKVTVLVMDLRGFTPFSETTAPEDVMAVLREFYETMGNLVEKHGGTVEHFAGDSMLVFFNAPLEIPQPEKQAVETALEMRNAFEPLRAKWARLGHELGLGIGVADGYATIGAIGFSGRSQYAAIGAVTNLASRLCASAQHGEILTTARVIAEVEALVESASAGEQTIRGFTRAVAVVKVLGLRSATTRSATTAILEQTTTA